MGFFKTLKKMMKTKTTKSKTMRKTGRKTVRKTSVPLVRITMRSRDFGKKRMKKTLTHCC